MLYIFSENISLNYTKNVSGLTSATSLQKYVTVNDACSNTQLTEVTYFRLCDAEGGCCVCELTYCWIEFTVQAKPRSRM